MGFYVFLPKETEVVYQLIACCTFGHSVWRIAGDEITFSQSCKGVRQASSQRETCGLTDFFTSEPEWRVANKRTTFLLSSGLLKIAAKAC